MVLHITAQLSLPAHTSTTGGTGAVGGIIPVPAQNMLISYGAEGTVAVIDLRRAAVHTKFTENTNSSSSVRGGSFIYCMVLAGQSLLVTGAGSGMLLVHDLQRLKLLYGMSANQGAVRCVAATDRHLAAAGDDGNALIYTFSDAAAATASASADSGRRGSSSQQRQQKQSRWPLPEWQS
eukprot:14694-Heterococcus_DN1.PRE.1